MTKIFLILLAVVLIWIAVKVVKVAVKLTVLTLLVGLAIVAYYFYFR